MRPFVPLVSATVLLGCLSGVSPAADVTGAWSAPPLSDNSSLVLMLGQRDGVVRGSGTYTIKVWVDTVQQTGPTYTVAVAGTYQAPAVRLVLTYRQGPGTSQMAFAGALQDSEHLTGRLDLGGDAVQLVTFTRR